MSRSGPRALTLGLVIGSAFAAGRCSTVAWPYPVASTPAPDPTLARIERDTDAALCQAAQIEAAWTAWAAARARPCEEVR